MSISGARGPSNWHSTRAEWSSFLTFRSSRPLNSPLVTPTALADYAMHRQREFSRQEARKPTNRRSSSSIAESVTSMTRTYAWANGIDADMLLAGGLGAHKRASARTDQKRSGGKSHPISAELLDTILPFMLDPEAPSWLSHFGLICARRLF